MNIRISKLYQGSPRGALEVAFNSCTEGDQMISEIAQATGLQFERPPANRFAMRELHIAVVGDDAAQEAAFVAALAVAEKYGEVSDSQKNMKGPGELTPNQLDEALKHRGQSQGLGE